MRNFLRNLVAALGVILTTTAAFALTSPPTFAPRMFQTQQVHYIRLNVNFNNVNGIPCVILSAGSNCVVKVGALPYNAFILRAYQQVVTAFNSGSTDTISLGVSTTATELVAAQSVASAGNMAALTVVVASAGLGNTSGASPGITGFNATPTGTDGGFDLYVKHVQTGSVPTAGQAIIVLEYIAPNDGSCQNYPMAQANAAC